MVKIDKTIKTAVFLPSLIIKLNKKEPNAKKQTSVNVSKAALAHFDLNLYFVFLDKNHIRTRGSLP